MIDVSILLPARQAATIPSGTAAASAISRAVDVRRKVTLSPFQTRVIAGRSLTNELPKSP